MNPALFQAWAAQSRELLLLTDADGRVRWCNPAASATLGLAEDDSLLAAAPPDWRAGAPRAALASALRGAEVPDGDWLLRGSHGTTVRVGARLTALGDERLWTFVDTTERHAVARRAQRLREVVYLAQEYGRIGLWEHDLVARTGSWDRHVAGFFGYAATDPVPSFEAIEQRIHPADRRQRYSTSLQRPGRHSARFRVLRENGEIRLLHSHWEVRSTPDGRPSRVLGVLLDDTAVYDLLRSRDAAAAQLKLVTELANVVTWRQDFATDRVVYSPQGARLLQVPYTAEGIPLAEVRARTHPDDLEKLADSAARALATDRSVDVQVRHRRRDGGWRDLLLRQVTERDAAGRPCAFVGVMLDVSTQSEQARRAERLGMRFEAAARAARLGVWSSSEQGHVTEYNAQMYRLLDRIEPPLLPTFDEFMTLAVFEPDRARYADDVRRYIADPSGRFESEFRTLRRDGSLRWIVIRADVETIGDRRQFVGIAMDSTERHETRAALDSAGARALLIARQAGIGTWESGAGEDIVWDEQMWRLRGLEPQARMLDRAARLALIHPDDRLSMIDLRGGHETLPPTSGAEFRVLHPDGRYRWLASRSMAVHDAQGRPVGRIGVNWDIDQAKNAGLVRQRALLAQRESRAKSRFLTRMSHELRTPLNAVLGFAQLLERDARAEGDAPREATLGHIRAAGEHLLTLIDDALDLSRVETGTMRLEVREVALAAAVDEALPLVVALADEQGVRLLRRELVGDVWADRTRLRQVLLNLLTNAIKYNRPGGQVTISAAPLAGPGDRRDESRPAEVALRVVDTGRGIRPEQLPELFQPFNRLGLEDEGIQGSGIGLTIVKSLVEGMGGRIEVRSAIGVGTTFEIVLPAAPSPAPPASLPTAPLPAATPQVARRVLYIEDNPVNVLLVEELLKLRPHLVLTAAPNGTEGVAAALDTRPELTLIDMQLPDFDGFEVLRRLRADPRTAGLRCIALSANALPEDVQRARDAGFDDYWTKPIEFRPFLAALDRLLPGAA